MSNTEEGGCFENVWGCFGGALAIFAIVAAFVVGVGTKSFLAGLITLFICALPLSFWGEATHKHK
ncbi:MAG TPA: hypothetical protein PL069_04720 [Saprospiraceae bacterium]|nr:hypothetical protein [Syntrophorhabdus sp.]HQP76688.1 hypothetical protein [Saprospiraceae bacterium]